MNKFKHVDDSDKSAIINSYWSIVFICLVIYLGYINISLGIMVLFILSIFIFIYLEHKINKRYRYGKKRKHNK
jgi:hypothetical protein